MTVMIMKLGSQFSRVMVASPIPKVILMQNSKTLFQSGRIDPMDEMNPPKSAKKLCPKFYMQILLHLE